MNNTGKGKLKYGAVVNNTDKGKLKYGAVVNNTGKGKLKYSGVTMSITTLYTKNTQALTWDRSRGLRGERPETKRTW